MFHETGQFNFLELNKQSVEQYIKAETYLQPFGKRARMKIKLKKEIKICTISFCKKIRGF